jgi:hypothetical protein
VPEGKRVLRQAFRRLEQELPGRFGRPMRWLRHPHSRWIRLPMALLLILGGVFSILPGLGIWMLPLGLLLIALDVPFLRKPMGKSTLWGADKWAASRPWLSERWRRGFRRYNT